MPTQSSHRDPWPAGASGGGVPAPAVVGLNEHLARRETDLSSILDQVRGGPGLEPGDALLAVGSLVEGLGTTKSDLDLLLITARPAERLPGDVVTLVAGKSVVDMRILALEALDGLVGRLRAWADTPWDVNHAVKFSIDDRTLLHRVLNGQLLAGDPALVAARAPDRDELCRLKLHVARQATRTILVDLVGYRDSGDPRSLAFGAQEILGHSIDALVAAYGNTNPLLKWRARLLESIPCGWEEALGTWPTGRSAAERVWDLQRLPAAPDPDACLLHASRITCFARAVFAWSERQLARRDLPPARPRSLPWPDRAGGTEQTPLPLLAFDLDIWLVPDGAAMARLNEFEEPVMISADELAMLLLFDGHTGAGEAERAIHGDHPAGSGAAARLVARLEAARMTAPRGPSPHRTDTRGGG